MEQKINIAEILKDAPKGIRLYSPMFGYCFFEEYQERERLYPIRVKFLNTHKEYNYHSFSIYGRELEIENGECMLFPSKENRDWSTFQAPWKHKHFEPFQKVLVLTRELVDGPQYYNADFYSHWDKSSEHHYTVGGLRLEDDEILDYEGNKDKLGKEVKDEE